MSLASVLQTAFSGMSAASLTVQVASNNLANAGTTGFKSSRPSSTPQTPQTYSIGSGPSATSGGSNPIQTGTGVSTGGVAIDPSQGAIVASSNPLHLALEGDGLFIVEGPSGQQSFTRAGEFGLNSSGQIVTSTGHRLLGYGVDDQHEIDDTSLQPLTIPLGSATPSGDGNAATLTGFAINQDGRIEGEYSDGVNRDLGQIRVARFANPAALEAAGDNLFRSGANSGQAVESNPGSGGSASIVGGASELSNTDIGQNIVDLTLASQQFQARAAVLRTADSLLDELNHLSRSDR